MRLPAVEDLDQGHVDAVAVQVVLAFQVHGHGLRVVLAQVIQQAGQLPVGLHESVIGHA